MSHLRTKRSGYGFYQMVGEEAPKRRQGQGQWGPLQNPFFPHNQRLLSTAPFSACFYKYGDYGELFVSSSINLELRPSPHSLTDLFM